MMLCVCFGDGPQLEGLMEFMNCSVENRMPGDRYFSEELSFRLTVVGTR